MKISYVSPELTRLYEQSDQWSRYYPRRIVCPNGYRDPKYWAQTAVGRSLYTEHGISGLDTSPESQRSLANVGLIDHRLGIAGVPTYFLASDFTQAVWQTEPRDRPPVAELHLPLDEMLIVLPVRVSTDIFFGFEVPFVAFAKVDDMVAYMGVSITVGGKHFMYNGRSRMNQDVGPAAGDGNYERAYIKFSNGEASLSLNESLLPPGVPTPGQDVLITDRIRELLYRLILVLQVQRDGAGFVTPGEMLREEREKKGRVKAALWSANIIGAHYKPKGLPQGGHHASPRLHWRRGHVRNQPHGPNRELRKMIWIEPQLIGS